MRDWSLDKGKYKTPKKTVHNQPIIHRTGKAERTQQWLERWHKLEGKLTKPKELTIVTIHNYPKKSLFEHNLEYLGIADYVLLRPPEGPFKHCYVPLMVRDFIRQGGCPTEYLLYCDARDSMIMSDLRKIVKIFESFNCKLLFSSTKSLIGCYGGTTADLYCEPLSGKLRCWANRTGVYRRYINSGVFIGKPAFIEEYFDYALRYISDVVHSDQGILRALQPMFHPHIKVDYSNELVYRN